MSWKSIDFEGIISLNKSIVDHLFQYLEDKESQLSRVIAHALHSSQSPAILPSLAPAEESTLKLSDAIEGFSRQIRQLSQSRASKIEPADWQQTTAEINKGLWEYVEVLDECVIEFFQQLMQVGMEEWKTELAHVVDAIKEMLIHRMDDLRWGIKRLENLLQQYRWACEEQQGKWVKWRKVIFFWQSLLDRSLSAHLEKSQKFLAFRYQGFYDRYKRYVELETKINLALEKFSWYKIFNTLETDSQVKFKKLYQLVRLWELNAKSRSLPQRDSIRALRNLISQEKALLLFKEYYQALHRSLFDQSRNVKEEPMMSSDPKALKQLQEEILNLRGELHTLGATIGRYRDFLLRTDPNPYVRSRLGFPEWIVGQEPPQTKQMLSLSYEVESLDNMFEEFLQAMERKSSSPDIQIAQVDPEIQEIFHVMGQPLISKITIKGQVEKLIGLIGKLDELSNTNSNVVEYIGKTLGKAMRADWKYHVLFDMPAFHKIYMIHHGVVGPLEDRNHWNRLQKFKRHIQQIEQWIKQNVTVRHTHEVELEMNDIKGYLQDFLAQVQRLVSLEPIDKDLTLRHITEIYQQLLEYRYLFGNFFHHLKEDKPEERMIRKQFLFVDQYFEVIENRLHEWSLSVQH